MKGFSFSLGGSSPDPVASFFDDSVKEEKRVAGFFDDDDEGAVKKEEPGPLSFFDAGDVEKEEKVDEKENDDSVDPLDAFMSSVDSTKKEEDKIRKRKVEDMGEEEDLEAFLSFHKQKKQADAKTKIILNEKGSLVDAKDGVVVLEALDHSRISYPAFVRDIYKPASNTMSAEQAVELRRKDDIRVRATDIAAVPPPCPTFESFGFGKTITDLLLSEFDEPTPIQKQVVPALVKGMDVIGIAKTGSGKTGGFVWPTIFRLATLPPPSRKGSPLALMVAPTLELAKQIFLLCKKWSKMLKFNVLSLIGGGGNMTQKMGLRGFVDIVVGTPGRIINYIKNKHLRMQEVRVLCVDEADRLLEMGFEPQLRSICGQIRPDRVTSMFSATFKPNVRDLAKDLLVDPVRINVGRIGSVNSDIHQIPVVVEEDNHKLLWLGNKLPSLIEKGGVLIFVAQKATADEVADVLQEMGFHVAALHGGKVQVTRKKIHYAFKHGALSVLVATDVASRGLDIDSVKTVIQYDRPKSIQIHTHRVGRTGRAGKKGTAYALILSKDNRFAQIVVTSMRQAQQEIPREMFNFNLNAKKRNNNGYNNKKRGVGYQ